MEPVWKMGYNGSGVVVSILDDGEFGEGGKRGGVEERSVPTVC